MRSEKYVLCDMRDDEIASNMWIKHEEHTVEMQRLSISGKTQFICVFCYTYRLPCDKNQIQRNLPRYLAIEPQSKENK